MIMNEISTRFAALKADGLLPSPRGVALAVMELSARPDASIRDIGRMIQADPAMAGRILRYANSAHQGSQRHIASLNQAITLLGLFRIRQIALGFSLIDQYRQGACSAFDYEGYWTGSLATGIAAQRLAGLAQCPPDESFTCGLLSGIGRLALATAFPQRYSVLLERKLAEAELLHEERLAFGIDHAELTAEMLVNWGLPGVFTNAIRHHENLAETTFVPGSRAHALSTVLHFSGQIGQLLSRDEAERWSLVPTLYNAAAQAGMAEEDVPAMIEEIVTRWQDWAKDLHLPTKPYADMRTLLAAPPPATDTSAVDREAHIPLSVGVCSDNDLIRPTLIEKLGQAGIRDCMLIDTQPGVDALDQTPPDILIVDTGKNPNSLRQLFEQARKAAGEVNHLIALIPDTDEVPIADILAAGATDYLPYGFNLGELRARLHTAQRLVALENTVRTERELAVSSSAEWARTNRRLLHEALTDPLTQLPNRRYGLDRFAQEWSIATSNGLPLACLMLDIDHFKSVNDQYGHDTGDLVLQQVAQKIIRGCRRNDVVFRYGGEEFCAICPAADEEDAMRVAERILDIIRSARFGPIVTTGTALTTTLSIGVALQDRTMPGIEELISCADQALYAAKTSGRNRAVCYTRPATKA